MKLPRLVLAGFICLGVSLQGFAGAISISADCPMEHASGHSMADTAQMGTSADCCNDAETFAKTGKLCKHGFSCPTASQIPASVPSLILIARGSANPIPVVDSEKSSFDPSFHWRPPALI
jgi:hypothetical protein